MDNNQIKYDVAIYTDGACSGNPGIGGWGVVITLDNFVKEFCGAEPETTNNRMELLAVIMGLKALKFPCNVKLFSDSAYVVNAFNEKWIDSWQRNGWRNAQKDEVKNKDLWQQLLELMNTHSVEFVKVKGHADNELNNRCDQLATSSIKKYIEEHPEAVANTDQKATDTDKKPTHKITQAEFNDLIGGENND
ncbi:MAG: ribonuclease HI [Clostridia bacterium]|nr:ribonuclease HI [Clostridia bacterium]